MGAKKLKITWKRSSIGCPRSEGYDSSFGFTKLNQEVIRDDTPVMRMIFKSNIYWKLQRSSSVGEVLKHEAARVKSCTGSSYR